MNYKSRVFCPNGCVDDNGMRGVTQTFDTGARDGVEIRERVSKASSCDSCELSWTETPFRKRRGRSPDGLATHDAPSRHGFGTVRIPSSQSAPRWGMRMRLCFVTRQKRDISWLSEECYITCIMGALARSIHVCSMVDIEDSDFRPIVVDLVHDPVQTDPR